MIQTLVSDGVHSSRAAPPRPGDELRLISAMRPFRGLALACGLHAFFSSGLYDKLDRDGACTADELVAGLGLDPLRTRSLLDFLAVEDIIVRSDFGRFELTTRGRGFGEFRAWYDILVGGYGPVFVAMAEGLRAGTVISPRRGECVASGSAAISLKCSLSMVRGLLEHLPRRPELILDVGCGSPEYLYEICRAFDCRGIGVEPDAAAFRTGKAHLQRTGQSARVELVQGSAQTCVPQLDVSPDVVLTAFVLHEVLGQSGEIGVRQFLRDLFAAAPTAYLLVVEVDLRPEDPSVMQHGYARNYYNGYYLLHPFTKQQLAPKQFWEELFESEHLEIVHQATTDADIDSTGLEVGYLIRRSLGA